MPYTQYTSLIHQCCHILKPVAFFGKQPARLVRQGGGGGVWTDHWEWKKGWFHFLTICRNFLRACCMLPSTEVDGGMRCECIRITDGRPPRCFQNKYSIPNVLSHQHSWARKQKYSFWLASPLHFVKILISILVIWSVFINMKIQQVMVCCVDTKQNQDESSQQQHYLLKGKRFNPLTKSFILTFGIALLVQDYEMI